MFPPEVHWYEGRCRRDGGEGVCVALLCVILLVVNKVGSKGIERGVGVSQQ